MLKLVLLVLVGAFAATYAADFYSCLWINNPDVDCALFGDDVSCGTDRQTYKNKCYLSKAHCKDTTIDLAYHGACNFTYTRPTRDPIQGAVIVNDFLCAFLSHRSCQDTFEPTCGTDGVSYKNFCEYEKARCTHRDLHVLHFGDCSA